MKRGAAAVGSPQEHAEPALPEAGLSTRIGAGLAFAGVALMLVSIARSPAILGYFGPGVGLFTLALAGLGIVLTRIELQQRVGATAACNRGALAGLALGMVWLLEIGINNVYPADRIDLRARDLIDDALWAFISVASVALAALATARAASWRYGFEVGAWCGIASGLVACVGGLLVLDLLTGSLERAPHYVDEFAGSGAPDVTTYVTSQLVTGSGLHLWVAGGVLGCTLAAIGASVGMLYCRVRSDRLGPRSSEDGAMASIDESRGTGADRR